MFARKFSLLTLTAVILFLTGCGFQRKPFDAAAYNDLQTISLLTIKNPDRYICYDIWQQGFDAQRYSHGALGMIIGDLLGASFNNDSSHKLTKLITSQKFDFAQSMSSKLQAELTRVGYVIEQLDFDRKHGRLLMARKRE